MLAFNQLGKLYGQSKWVRNFASSRIIKQQFQDGETEHLRLPPCQMSNMMDIAGLFKTQLIEMLQWPYYFLLCC